MKIRVGTRGSQLALAQTNMVVLELKAKNPGLEVEIIDIKTVGDRKQGTAAAAFGDKKDWIYDLELAILAGSVDLAIHSGKDVPGNIEAGTVVLPVLKRGNPLDAFIPRKGGAAFKDLARGALVGTASLRRKASLLRLRPDLNLIDHRGNVPTRLRKLEENAELSGIVLACAGLERLAIKDLKYEVFRPSELMPSLNQGTLTIQYKHSRNDIASVCNTIVDEATKVTFDAERACAEILEGDCNSAIGIFAELLNGELRLSCRVMSQDGAQCLEMCESAAAAQARNLGEKVGKDLLNRGARAIMACGPTA